MLSIHPVTVQERLRRYVGGLVSIMAVDFASEPGRLQKVYRRTWVRVTGQYFNTASLNGMIIHGVTTPVSGTRGTLRTTYRGTVDAYLIGIGLDFIEVVIEDAGGPQRVIIPLNKIVSIQVY